VAGGSRGARGWWAAATALTVLAVAACTQPVPEQERTTDVDRDRARTLQAEPVLAGTTEPVQATPGRVLGEKLGWDRSEVDGVLYRRARTDAPPVPPAAQVQARVAKALRSLRDAGWVVLWTRCEVPPAGSAADGDTWVWDSSGYKVADGVSYGFTVRGEYHRAGNGAIGVRLLAPNHRDAANLFPDAPRGLAPAATCIEQPGVATATRSEGVELRVAERMSRPGADRPRDVRER
jgi:hypothetical protein